MSDQPCTNKLANQRCQVRRDSCHPVFEVFVELLSVFGDGDDLVAELVDVIDVGVSDLCTHTDLGGGFEGGFEFFGEDIGEGGG